MNSRIGERIVNNPNDHDYHAYLARIQQRFVDHGTRHLFTTDAQGLWDAYLACIPEAQRQRHNCSACRRFVHVYGAHLPGVTEVIRIVHQARVTGVVLSSATTWGQPLTGVWRHWAIKPPSAMIFCRMTQTARQAMAARREDFKNLQVALAEFTLPTVEQALTLLETAAFYRSEKVLGQAQFLKAVHTARNAAPRELKNNVIWRLLAAAPAGFCHLRSSMIGTLLEDIAAGLDFTAVSRRFAEKMHPLRYQRPQADPAGGTIAQAERIAEQLGATGALRRRFARNQDIRALWRPTQPAQSSGVFGQLRRKGRGACEPMAMPGQTMTWGEVRSVGTAECRAHRTLRRQHAGLRCGLVTAADPNAPPILQWDSTEARNPMSWYVWHSGSLPGEFSLQYGRFHEVDAVTLKPSRWGGAGIGRTSWQLRLHLPPCPPDRTTAPPGAPN